MTGFAGLSIDPTKVKVRQYADGCARFYIENKDGKRPFADTYSPAATKFLRAALKESA